jgi:hypothetical protein
MKQLGAAASTTTPIEAVVMLRAVKPTKKGADDTNARATALLGRVASATGLEPLDVNVFANLDSFVVRAEAPFIERLLEQAEVSSATANRRPDDDMLLSAKPPR